MFSTLSVALRTGDPGGALRAAELADEGWAAGDPYIPGTWAQVRIGASIAHLVKDSLDGAVEQVTPMLALSPEYRIATVTGWLTDLDHHLASKRFASSPAAAGTATANRRLQRHRAAARVRKERRMTTLPVQMIDRWASRSEPGPGQGIVYWHMLMNDHPQVVSLATKAQQRLAPFTGLHMTPLERLHMTTMIAGPSHDFSDDQLHRMIEAAGDLLSRTPPIAVTLGQILYHPEAIMLAVTPAQALMPVRDAVQAATQLVTGENPPTDIPRWTPHVTISYSTSAKPAGPIIAALGPQLPGCEIQVSAVSLVIQHGPERLWDWHTIGTVHLPAPART